MSHVFMAITTEAFPGNPLVLIDWKLEIKPAETKVGVNMLSGSTQTCETSRQHTLTPPQHCQH